MYKLYAEFLKKYHPQYFVFENVLGLLSARDEDKTLHFNNMRALFKKVQGLPIEKKRCIYLRDDVTDNQIVANLIANPVKALVESGYFFYDALSQMFSISPEIWEVADSSSKSALTEICYQRLKDYYED